MDNPSPSSMQDLNFDRQLFAVMTALEMTWDKEDRVAEERKPWEEVATGQCSGWSKGPR